MKHIPWKTGQDIHLCGRVMLGVPNLAFLLHFLLAAAPVVPNKRDGQN